MQIKPFNILTSLLLIISIFISPCLSGTIPQRKILNVPFLCQAPSGDWREPYQDACEEASIIMAMHFVKGGRLDKTIGKKEILELVKFQIKHYGGHFDLTAEQSIALMNDYYNFKDARLIDVNGKEDIINEVASGNIVIVPAAGKLLRNKYYTPPGPGYHYLLIKGYDDEKDKFITNDPGTKRGEGLSYKYNVLLNAVHDWTGKKQTIEKGRKIGMVISRTQ